MRSFFSYRLVFLAAAILAALVPVAASASATAPAGQHTTQLPGNVAWD